MSFDNSLIPTSWKVFRQMRDQKKGAARLASVRPKAQFRVPAAGVLRRKPAGDTPNPACVGYVPDKIGDLTKKKGCVTEMPQPFYTWTPEVGGYGGKSPDARSDLLTVEWPGGSWKSYLEVTPVAGAAVPFGLGDAFGRFL
jgi:hypothetical protein